MEAARRGPMKRNVEPIVPTPAVGARANDSELVSRALLGEDWAREALFRNHVSAVTATVLRLSSRSEDAEDIVQDAFVAAFTELDRLRDHSAFRAWLLSIAVRKLHRRFRRRKFM